MDGQLFRRLYRRLLEISSLHRQKREQYADLTIASTFLWAVLHDQPQGWACHREHWTIQPLVEQLPSESQLSRRLRTKRVQQLLDHLLDYLWGRFKRRLTKCIDGRALTVSFSSKDPTARLGAVASRTLAKGYKLHVITDTSGVLCAWAVSPLNHGEPTVARRLISRLSEGGYLLADNGYDSNPLYTIAGGHGLQLVAPPRPSAKSLGKRRHSPFRLRALALLKQPFGRDLMRLRRTGVERFFGNLGWRQGGLSKLPAFVRTMRRVRRWVQGKLILDALHYERLQGLHQ
jgi:hypothetical protein